MVILAFPPRQMEYIAREESLLRQVARKQLVKNLAFLTKRQVDCAHTVCCAQDGVGIHIGMFTSIFVRRTGWAEHGPTTLGRESR